MRRSTLFFAAVVLVSCSGFGNAQKLEENAQKVKELLDLQRRSANGVIDLDTAAFNKYTEGKNRPYSVFLFGDAKQFRKQSKLNLEGRFDAFATVARAFAATHAGKPTETKVFFVRIMFEDAREIFGRLGVKGLPYIVRIPPGLNIRATSAIQIPKSEEMGGSMSSMPTAQDFGNYVQQLTALSPGDLSAAGAGSRSRFLPLITLAVMAALCAVGYRLYYAPFMRSPALYVVGGLAIMWFSVSGGMFNIIRGVPFVGYNPRTQTAMVFMQGSGQMGAEGFIMGTFYMAFGLLVASFSRFLPAVKVETERRVWGWAMLGGCGVLLQLILSSHVWKTGMHSYWYFFG